jgi:UDP-N-acetylmuramate--alanine ligase
MPVYYDYAHHPSEIRAFLGALKARYGTVALIFRPHTYSRTASLWSDFVSALSLADGVILLDVYPAREEPISGISSRRLAECIDGAIYCESMADAASLAVSLGCDAVALVGAGDVETVRLGLIALGENNEGQKEK